jgi:nitroimidazol reductase NimA-like FMN-containing flavoprotein (pyridoxamine 5'-phosphate oxidase superfamily)/ferredoxin
MSVADKQALEITSQTRVRRFPQRGKYDLETIYGILDQAPMAHISFIKDGKPALIPMTFWRVDDVVYFHGAEKNRMFGAFHGQPYICFTATLLDGFVAARDALHHSLNYRCVIAYGEVEQVTDPTEKLEGLKNLVDRFYPDRWGRIQPPSQSEFERVTMYKFPLKEASAKIAAETAPYPDYTDVKVWSGIIPVGLRMGEPVFAPGIDPASVPAQDFSNIEYVTGKRVNEAVSAPVQPVKHESGAVAEERVPGPDFAFYAAPLGGQVNTVFQLPDGSTRSVKANVGETVLVAAKTGDITGIVGECGGCAVCGTCHVVVANDWRAIAGDPNEWEAEVLEFVEGGAVAGSRLACQIVLADGMDGLIVTVPEQQR